MKYTKNTLCKEASQNALLLNAKYTESVYNTVEKTIKATGLAGDYRIISKEIKMKSYPFYYCIGSGAGWVVADTAGRAYVGTERVELIKPAMQQLLKFLYIPDEIVVGAKNWTRVEVPNSIAHGLFGSSRVLADVLTRSMKGDYSYYTYCANIGTCIANGSITAYYIPNRDFIENGIKKAPIRPEVKKWATAGGLNAILHSQISNGLSKALGTGQSLINCCSAGFDTSCFYSGFTNFTALQESAFGYFALVQKQYMNPDLNLMGLIGAEYFATMIDMTPFRGQMSLVTCLDLMRDKRAALGVSELGINDIYGRLPELYLLDYDNTPSSQELTKILSIMAKTKPATKVTDTAAPLNLTQLTKWLAKNSFESFNRIGAGDSCREFIFANEPNITLAVISSGTKIEEIILRFSGVNYGAMTSNFTPSAVARFLMDTGLSKLS